MLFLDGSDAALEKAAAMLRSGGIVAFPTETVYGLGAAAFDTRALARVFEAKGRPRFDPLIIHLADRDALERIADLDALDARRRGLLDTLAETFWPGPLTLVLPKRPEVPDLATAALPTAAIRIPRHPLARRLIALSTGAVAAPSANPFGRLSPTTAAHVIEGLGDSIDCVIDGGPCEMGVESTVLDLSSDTVRILRPGGVGREELEAAAGTGVIAGAAARYTEGGAAGPGMLKSHYAPRVPLVLRRSGEMPAGGAGEAVLFFSGATRDAARKTAQAGDTAEAAGAAVLTLSENGSTLEAAANLFEFLHRLEKRNPARIYAEILPDEGLGAA
ncbi:MAG: threonylcarbamoyl-AMP synthase, partial [Treponema sp.]|nr:threonylcarbamoyl-AMP synthase [Treponema sp.]